MSNSEIKCQHIVLIVKKAFENVNSLSENSNSKLVYSRIQQSLKRDKIFNDDESYEILKGVSVYLFDCVPNSSIDFVCYFICHNLVHDLLIEQIQYKIADYRLQLEREVSIETSKIVRQNLFK